MNVNIIIAALLAVLTSLMAYAAWYIVRGRNKIEKAAAAKAKENKPAKKDGKEPKKEPYYHAAINDVMGYEFVSVVPVPEYLLEDKKQEEEQADKWAEQRAVGLTTISDSTEEQNPDNPDIYIPRDRPQSGAVEQPTAGEEPTQENVEEVETVAEMDPETIEDINRVGGEWNHRDIEDGFSDEYLDVIIDKNADMIEMTGHTEDDYRTSEEHLLLNNMIKFEQKIAEGQEIDDVGFDILLELGDIPDEPEDKETE